jgi:hypothetical protein
MSSWHRNQNTFRYEKRRYVDNSSIDSFVPELPEKRDLVNMVYTTPKCSDTVVILVFFNPTGSFRILQNLLYVKHQLENASIPFFIGELAYNNEPHIIPKGSNIFQFRSTSYMFSKENIAAAVIQHDKVKTSEYTKYVLMDCDVVFDTHGWVDGISEALNSYDVIQPFQYCNQLNLRFKSECIKASIAFDPTRGHTGYVWAFRRDWLERIGGLYEYALIGGGDRCLAYIAGLIPEWLSKPYEGDLPIRGDPEKTWYMSYTVWHLPHGSLDKRQYIERKNVLNRAMVSLQIDRLQNAVDRGVDGIFEWKPAFKSHFNSVLLNYFKSRDDDGY